MKKKLLISLAVLLGLLICCAVASGETTSGKWGTNLSWTLDDNGLLTISGKGEMASNTSEPYVNDYQKVKKVVIESGVTSIGEWAFEFYRSMEEISIPKTVTRIEWGAFWNCSAMKSISIPDSVTQIGSSAFYGCKSLIKVTIPGKVTAIAGNAFYGCSSLEKVIIPKSVTNIGSKAFYQCTALKTVDYSGSDKEWSAISFGNGNMLLRKAKGDDTLGSGSCGDKVQWKVTRDGLLSITGTGKMTDYDSYSSSGCPWRDETMVSSVEIGTGITYIGDYAFDGLNLVKPLRIPSSVRTFGKTAFNNFSGTLIFEGDAPAFEDGIFSKSYIIVRYPKGNSTWGKAAGQKYGAEWIAWITEGNDSEDKKRDETEKTEGEVTSNENQNNYYNWSHTTSSYLTEGENGTLYRVEYTGENIVIEQYDENKRIIWKKTLKMELPLWGGFYSGKDYYFIVVGQSNWEEKDETEIMRVIRYSKNWNRVDAAGIHGANTVMPFGAGSLQMAQTGDYLFIHTCHEMYKSYDGKNHQANMNYKLYIPNMSFIDSETTVSNDVYDYVSHSFNQFVIIDGADVIKVDHGDAYPRSVTMLRRRGTAESLRESGSSRVTILKISGETGDNYTGVSVGGADVSSTHYIVAGKSIDQTKFRETDRDNLFVAAVPRNSFNDSSVVFRWITNYPETDTRDVSTPQFVKISGKQFLLMWTESDKEINNVKERTLRYVFLDNTGSTTSEVYSVSGLMSDCKPVVRNNRITWYVTRNTDTVFYTIDLDNPNNLSIETYSNWIDQDGARLYYGEDGKLATGFRKINITVSEYDYEKQETVNRVVQNTYYFDNDGKMVTGDRVIDGKRYHFGEDGALVEGFYTLDDATYYLTENGALTGLQQIEETIREYNWDSQQYETRKVTNIFFFDENGVMQTGLRTLDGRRYYFDDDGALITGFYKVDGAAYFFTKDGALTGLQQIKETDEDYNWDTHEYETKEVTNVYYFDENGVMQTGFRTVNGEKMYFNSRGRKVCYTAPEPITDLFSAGYVQELIKGGTIEDDYFLYALGKDEKTAPSPEEYSLNIPMAMDAGTYYVWYRLSGDDAGAEVITATITDKVRAFVSRCYRLILNREADEGGLNGWSDALKSKTAAAAQIIDGFIRSDEFVNRKLSAGESVEILYNTMLDRKADEGGKAGWVDALNKGYTLQNIIDGFCGSDEFTAICDSYDIEPGKVGASVPTPDTPRGKIEAFVKRCYKMILSRDADESGLKGWSDALESRQAAAAQIIDGFVRSPEFINRNLSAGESVDILYSTMLDRQADEGGRTGWVDALGKGFTLQHIINGFCGSAEFTAICDNFGITAGSVAVSGAMVEHDGITPAGGEKAAPVIYVKYTSEYTNAAKVRAFVKHCYNAAFGREGDAEGVDAYAKLILQGEKSPRRVAYEFIFSAEFQNNLPGNEDFIRILYKLYLNREPGADELAGWVSMLENGANLVDIVNGFAASEEFKAIVNGMKN